MTLVYQNGSFIDEEKASVSILDRGFLFGDGVFTTMKVVDGKVQFFQKHLNRLITHCELLNIEFPEIHYATLMELVDKNSAKEGGWRLKIIITGGSSSLLSLSKRVCGNVIITLKPYERELPEQAILAVYPESVIRPSSRIKSLAYLDRLYIKEFALKNQTYDALVLSKEGYILETAFSNLFWCRDHVFYMPSKKLDLLSGIALEVYCEVAEKIGMQVVEVEMLLDQLESNTHVFCCNALTGLVPIHQIGNMTFSRDMKLEEQFHKAFQTLST